MARGTSVLVIVFLAATILAVTDASHRRSNNIKHHLKTLTDDQAFEIPSDASLTAIPTKTAGGGGGVGPKRRHLVQDDYAATDYAEEEANGDYSADSSTEDYAAAGDYSSPAVDYGDYSPPAPDYVDAADEEDSSEAEPDYESSSSPGAGEYAEYTTSEEVSPPEDDSGDGGVTAVPVTVPVSDNCPSVEGKSCLALDSSDSPQLSDAMTLVAADLASEAYSTGEEGIDYAKSVLGAADARFISDSTTGTQVLVAIDKEVIIVAFRGTELGENSDVTTDALAELVPTSFGSAGTASVHKGFLKAFESIDRDLTSILREVNAGDTYKLYFSGHSLGSGLATLAAAKVQSDSSLGQSVNGIISLAGPRVGDSAWADAYSELGLDSKTLRIVFYKDCVPMLPPESMDYKHVGRAANLPIDYSTCSETGDAEFDVCEADANILNFIGALGSQLACSTMGNTLISAYCTLSDNPITALCPYLKADTLAGNLCCTAVEALPDLGETLKAYHSADTYLTAIVNSCTSECADRQYRQCGGGFTTEDQAIFDAPALVDPVLSLNPEVAQQVYTQSASSSTTTPGETKSSSFTAWSKYGTHFTTCITALTIVFAFFPTFFC